jgi:hypothetical protein
MPARFGYRQRQGIQNALPSSFSPRHSPHVRLCVSLQRSSRQVPWPD